MPRANAQPTPAAPESALTGPITPKPTTKSDTVLGLMRRSDGATLAELVLATGWLPHTARAMLTGLRKKGHAIERRKRGDVTCYHLALEEA